MGTPWIRIVTGVVGLSALLLASRIWIDPAPPAAALGLSALSAVGLATLRADVGGFFGALGVLTLVAAIRNEGRLLMAPLVMVCVALAGRVVSLAVDGGGAAMLPPMLVEAALIALFWTGRRALVRA